MSSLTTQGVDDERSGELPRAFVVRSSDDLTEQQVEDYVKGLQTVERRSKIYQGDTKITEWKDLMKIVEADLIINFLCVTILIRCRLTFFILVLTCICSHVYIFIVCKMYCNWLQMKFICQHHLHRNDSIRQGVFMKFLLIFSC